MPRKSRNYFANTPYLIFQFGHNFQPCFFEEADYHFFTDLITQHCDQCQVTVNHCQLFNNQFLLVLTASLSQSIPKVLQSTCSMYGRYVNEKYYRTGSLWQGRHKASPVQAGENLQHVIEFIRSPVLPRQFHKIRGQNKTDLPFEEYPSVILDCLSKNQPIGDETFRRTVNNHNFVQVKKTIVPRTRNGLMPLLSDKPGRIRSVAR